MYEKVPTMICSWFQTFEYIKFYIQLKTSIYVEKYINSDKMIKRKSGYFINPLSFKELGGSDIFFVSVLEKMEWAQ